MANDSQWALAIKDESLLLFSLKPVPDDAIITQVFYDRQDVWAMGDWDWADQDTELARLRKAVVDDLAHTVRHVRQPHAEITPVLSQKQIQAGNSYIIFVGWYKRQCVVVQPEYTVADLKAYLHSKNGQRLPMESIDIGLRCGDEIQILDAAMSLQKVYEKSCAAPVVCDEPTEEDGVEDGVEDIVLENPSTATSNVPSFVGQALLLGVGKRIQDRKHSIWLPQAHDPYSFRGPEDKAAAGGTTRYDALPAPRMNGGPIESASTSHTSPHVNQEDACCIM